MRLLEEKLQSPVDIEFASDGRSLLSSPVPAPELHGGRRAGPHSPRTCPKTESSFLANRFISNGSVPDITHIVYVDPESYDGLSRPGGPRGRGTGGRPAQQAPAAAPLHPDGAGTMGKPGRHQARRQGLLFGHLEHGRFWWRSPGRKGNYLPDLSFGTHFFQDLVEAEIRYLPLYPDEHGTALPGELLQGLAEHPVPRLARVCRSRGYRQGDRRTRGRRTGRCSAS